MVLSVCCLGLLSNLHAQQAKECFLQMPDSLYPILTDVNRADCIDFLESKMKAEVTNRFGQKTEMTELAPDYIALRTSDQSTWQMKLLPTTDSTQVICTIQTVTAPVADSHLNFYTTRWEPLPLEQFLPQKPTLDNFFTAPADTTQTDAYQQAIQAVSPLLLKAEVHAQDPHISFTLTTLDHLGKEEAEKLKPFVKRLQVKYNWTKETFVLQE